MIKINGDYMMQIPSHILAQREKITSRPTLVKKNKKVVTNECIENRGTGKDGNKNEW